MRQSKMLIPTLKQNPKGAVALSHIMMLRGGYIHQVSAGIYAYLPLAYRVLEKIEKIINDEMQKIGAIRMLVPTLLPAKLWKESGRLSTYGPELFKLKNRRGTEYILGPTHEETFTALIRDTVNSYKDLPLILYQIQSKFRDENRPRYGLLRGREFLMKDAYSFSLNDKDLDRIYHNMDVAYRKIFDKMQLHYRPIIGNGGAMGGSDSQEFSAPAKVGEDTIVYSDKGDYQANLEMATSKCIAKKPDVAPKKLVKKSCPNTKTIKKLAKFLKVEPKQIIKSVLFIANKKKPVLVLVRGDHDVNPTKIQNFLGADFLDLATPSQIKKLVGCVPGYVGPVNTNVKILADDYVKYMVNTVAGANENDYDYVNVNPGRDFKVDAYGDFRLAKEGDVAPNGVGHLKFTPGIEIAHIFKLGTRYSKDLGATVLNENGKRVPVIMGCYGIGVSRLLSAIAEQQSDDNGLVWPISVAPFDIHIIPVNVKNDVQMNLALSLDKQLTKDGYEVLLDDRKKRAGVKFADSDLIGIPLRITVGRDAKQGVVEVKIRKTGKTVKVRKDELENTIPIFRKELSNNK
ncbi:proline--tRNA ligase [uncultured bacterium]|nr:proline--tRNA ligase [uncultured bacterium]